MKTRHLFLFLLALLIFSTANAEPELTIIKLKGRTAEEIIPLIKPFVDQNDTITGVGNQLILRTSPERLADIQKILDKFDRPPRRLVIHVRQGRLTEGERKQLSAGINADIGEHVTVEAGEKANSNTLRLSARTRHTRRDNDISQHIQTLEGKAAFIATGKIIPIQEQSTYIARGRIHQQQTTRFQDATTGFYVTPRLNEDRVTLQISPHMHQATRPNGTLEIQQASTTLSGRLGEWIAVGGAQQSSNQHGTGLTRYRSTQNESNSQIYLRVEEIKTD
jgi:type II secretory pathway component HofQ